MTSQITQKTPKMVLKTIFPTAPSLKIERGTNKRGAINTASITYSFSLSAKGRPRFQGVASISLRKRMN